MKYNMMFRLLISNENYSYYNLQNTFKTLTFSRFDIPIWKFFSNFLKSVYYIYILVLKRFGIINLKRTN